MNHFATFGLITATAASVIVLPNLSYAQGSFTGMIERVWEDGFRLRTGDRTLIVDSWDVYGDNTARYLAVGDRVTVTGEFEGSEFDAFSIMKVTTSER